MQSERLTGGSLLQPTTTMHYHHMEFTLSSGKQKVPLLCAYATMLVHPCVSPVGTLLATPGPAETFAALLPSLQHWHHQHQQQPQEHCCLLLVHSCWVLTPVLQLQLSLRVLTVSCMLSCCYCSFCFCCGRDGAAVHTVSLLLLLPRVVARRRAAPMSAFGGSCVLQSLLSTPDEKNSNS